MNDIIKLDWDNITREEAYRRCDRIHEIYFVSRIELRSSATSGYHAYVTISKYISDKFTKALEYRLRRAWKDDGRRLVIDMLYRNEQTPKDILFTSKTIGGLTWYEIPEKIWEKT